MVRGTFASETKVPTHQVVEIKYHRQSDATGSMASASNKAKTENKFKLTEKIFEVDFLEKDESHLQWHGQPINSLIISIELKLFSNPSLKLAAFTFAFGNHSNQLFYIPNISEPRIKSVISRDVHYCPNSVWICMPQSCIFQTFHVVHKRQLSE